MKVKIALAAMAALLGSASLTPAAQTIVSPALQTASGTAGACYIRNVGSTPIFLQVTVLENFSPDFITPDFQNCNGEAALAPGKTCVLLVNDLPDDVTFECSATALSGNVRNLRGTAELRLIDRNGLQVLAAQDLR